MGWSDPVETAKEKELWKDRLLQQLLVLKQNNANDSFEAKRLGVWIGA